MGSYPVKYMVLEEYNASKLSSQVSHYLKEGWELYGFLQVTFITDPPNNHIHYAQSLIKR